MLAMIRSAALTGYASLARTLGLHPEQLADSVGLPISALQSPDLNVPIAQVTRLLELSAAASVEDFGLRLAQTREISNLGLLPVVAREAPTMRTGLVALARYARLHSEALSLRLERMESTWLVCPLLGTADAASMRQALELAMGVLHRMLRELFGDDWKPELVCFAHPPPDDLARHRRVFGNSVQFNAVVPGFVCASAGMERPRSVQESLLARDARAHLEGLLARHQPGVAAKVREMIAWLLPTGLCSAEAVAKRLGLQRRTLHRYLEKEGESYASLLDEVRRDLAREMIGQQRRPLKQVAAALGFEGQSALSRWFRHEFGYSATEWSSRSEDRAA